MSTRTTAAIGITLVLVGLVLVAHGSDETEAQFCMQVQTDRISLLEQRIKELESRVARLEDKQVGVDSETAEDDVSKLMQQLADPNYLEAQLDAYIQQDPNIAMLQQQLLAKQYDLSTKQSPVKRSRSKEIDRQRQEIAALNRQIAQYRAQIKQQMLRQSHKKLREQLEGGDNDIPLDWGHMRFNGHDVYTIPLGKSETN